MSAVAAIFPGQGSHAPGMDEPWREHPRLREGLELLGHDPFASLQEGTASQQPALLLVCVCAWEAAGITPVSAAGHSLGEYAALVAAGALAFPDAVRVVQERGAAMAEAGAAQPGGMVALLGGEPSVVDAAAAASGLVLANDNAPGQVVLSGSKQALDRLDDLLPELAERPPRTMRLDVAGAFHSPLMQPAADRLQRALAGVELREPAFPVFSGATAAPFTDPRQELADALLAPVRFRETLEAMRAAGADAFTEVGPGRALSGLVKRTLGREHLAAAA